MCYSRNASTKVPGNRKVNRFFLSEEARARACVQLAAKHRANHLDSERENALCKMARRRKKRRSIDRL